MSLFFLTADYAFGTQLEKGAAEVVKAGGGTVVGDVRVPFEQGRLTEGQDAGDPLDAIVFDALGAGVLQAGSGAFLDLRSSRTN